MTSIIPSILPSIFPSIEGSILSAFGAPSLMLDFARNAYSMGAIGSVPSDRTFASLITFSRSSGGGRINAAGEFEWVGNDVPRLTYDPVTLQPLGLLVEEQRTNLCTSSNEFSFSFNSGSRAVLAVNSSVSPSGLTDADNLSNPTGTTAVFNRSAAAVVSGQTYTDSFFMRPGVGQSGSIGVYFGGATSTGGVFRSLTVLSGVLSSSNADTVVSAWRDGWYRVECTYAPTVTAVTQVFNLSAGMSFDLWGAQLELGSSASSYIPTEASQVTRAADVCSVNTLSPWYNPLAGTFKERAAGIIGQAIVTAGTAIILADSASMKNYSLSYSVNPSATSLVVGKGIISSISYFPRSGA